MARTVAGLPKGTRISDYVTLGVLTTTVPASLIDAVLADTGSQSIRQRSLPARLVVYYVMALALYGQASYGEVLRCLLEGVRWLHRHQPRFCHQVLDHQGPAPPGSGSPGRTVPSRRPAARRAGPAGLLLPGPPADQPGRHHHRPARCPRPGDALRAARRLARGERLSPAAPAGAG